MKTSVVVFSEEKDKSEYLSRILKLFEDGNITVDSLFILEKEDDLGFLHIFSDLKRADNLIIIGADKTDFSVKDIICKEFDTNLIENEIALNTCKALEEKGIKISEDDYSLPITSTVIKNELGSYQGFLIENDDFLTAVLPFRFLESEKMLNEYLIPYLITKYKTDVNVFTFKYFGAEEKLLCAIDKAKENTFVEDVYFKENYGDFEVSVEMLGKDAENDVKQVFMENLGDGYYYDGKADISEVLFDLLKLRGYRVSTAESFTSGKIATSLLRYSGASKVVYEGIICYNENSKRDRLKVNEYELVNKGAVSSRVAYEMALGLLKTGNCDLAIATTGVAGPNSDLFNNPVGLNYIAIGLKDGIHVYKNVFSGTRKEVTERAVNTATFLAINKIKNI